MNALCLISSHEQWSKQSNLFMFVVPVRVLEETNLEDWPFRNVKMKYPQPLGLQGSVKNSQCDSKAAFTIAALVSSSSSL